MNALFDWLNDHQTLMGWLAGISAVAFVSTLLAIPVIVVRMPADYFLGGEPSPERRRSEHPVVRLILVGARNVVGVVLILLGLVLSLPLVPGQGILTILIGLSLVSFPGKRKLELRLARQRPVLGAINWMRARAKQPALRLPTR